MMRVASSPVDSRHREVQGLRFFNRLESVSCFGLLRPKSATRGERKAVNEDCF
jgi:hypothetical protein